jgi:hypothetical protein
MSLASEVLCYLYRHCSKVLRTKLDFNNGLKECANKSRGTNIMYYGCLLVFRCLHVIKQTPHIHLYMIMQMEMFHNIRNSKERKVNKFVSFSHGVAYPFMSSAVLIVMMLSDS